MEEEQSGWCRCIKLRLVELVDGTKDKGMLMRRKKADGTWEYRRLTMDEIRDAAPGRD